jgi:pyruvate/2-oxoglutarate dehydrogenase complex dihydrolipoamide acyltransferase (E2) component
VTVAYEFKLPDLGEGLTEGEIARWLVSEGQEIAEDDPLVEIQTDKTTVEIPSPAAGTVSSILVEEGKVVPVGTVLVVIGGDPDGQPRAATPERPSKARVTPLVRKIAQELGVELDSLSGTGPQGRITEEDVRGAAGPSEGRREPLRGVRRVIAEHMARAHREVPAVTWVEECDFSGMDLKQLVPSVLKACAETLNEFPELNARLERDATSASQCRPTTATSSRSSGTAPLARWKIWVRMSRDSPRAHAQERSSRKRCVARRSP